MFCKDWKDKWNHIPKLFGSCDVSSALSLQLMNRWILS